MDEYMKSIDLALTDERKSVTAKWLNIRLNIPHATTSSVLSEYLKRKGGNGTKLHATYVVTGICTTCAHKVVTVFANEAELEETRKRFARILSERLFSVQRFVVDDFTKLYLADFDAVRDHVTEAHAKRVPKRVIVKAQASVARSDEKSAVSTAAVSNEGVTHYRKGTLLNIFSKKGNESEAVKAEEQDSGATAVESRTKAKAKPNASKNSRQKAAPKAKATPDPTPVVPNAPTKAVGKRIRVFEDDSSCEDSDSEPEEPLPKRRATATEESTRPKNLDTHKSTDQEPCTKPKFPEAPILFDSDSDEDEQTGRKNANERTALKDASPVKGVANSDSTTIREQRSGDDHVATMTRRVPVQRTFLGEDGFLVTETVYQTETVTVNRDDERSSKRGANETDRSENSAASKPNGAVKRTEDAKNNNADKTNSAAQSGKRQNVETDADKPQSSRGRPSKKQQAETGPKQAQLTSWFKKV